jgi:hypothetical protein
MKAGLIGYSRQSRVRESQKSRNYRMRMPQTIREYFDQLGISSL